MKITITEDLMKPKRAEVEVEKEAIISKLEPAKIDGVAVVAEPVEEPKE